MSTQENVSWPVRNAQFVSDLLEIVTINLRGLFSLLKLEITWTALLSCVAFHDICMVSLDKKFIKIQQ